MSGVWAIAGLVDGGFPDVVGIAAAAFDALGVLGDQDVFFEAVEFLVVSEFVAAIEFLGAFGEDFGNEFRVAFDVAVFPIAWIVGDEGVRAVEEFVVMGDFYFVVDAAGGVI